MTALTLPLAVVRDGASRIRTVAVFLHVYHLYLVEELARHVARLPHNLDADLFASVVDEIATEKSLALIRRALPRVRIVVCPNRGADIGGLFAVLRDGGVTRRYDAWCKIHTKQSAQCPRAQATAWRKCLLTDILGSEEVVTTCLYAIANLGAGTIGSRWCLRDSWLDPRPCHRLGIPHQTPVRFVAGTMFWASGEVLDLLLSSGITADDFAAGFVHDGRLEHAFERTFGCFPVWGSYIEPDSPEATAAYRTSIRDLSFPRLTPGARSMVTTFVAPGEVRVRIEP